MPPLSEAGFRVTGYPLEQNGICPDLMGQIPDEERWAETFFTHRDLVTDPKLASPFSIENGGFIPRLVRPRHPDLEPLLARGHPALAGENSSWSSWTAKTTVDRHLEISAEINAVLRSPEPTARSQRLERLRQEISINLGTGMKAFLECLSQTEGLDFDPVRLRLFESGTAAIAATKPRNSFSITTMETGSQVAESLGPNPTEVQLRDAVHQTRPTQFLGDEFRSALARGVRHFAIPLVSKTGLILEKPLQSLGADIATWNRDHGTDPAVLVVDAVQAFGRIPDVFSWLETDGVSALVMTGSKAAGGLPHAGFCMLSEMGEKVLGPDFADEHNNLAPSAPLQSDEVILALRAIDNIRAVVEHLSHHRGVLYSDHGRSVRQMYASVFAQVGFELEPYASQYEDGMSVPSIISFRLPRMETAEIRALQERLGREGSIMLGGLLEDEESGRDPILRFTLSPIALETVPQEQWPRVIEVLKGRLESLTSELATQ